jgi:plasmid stabilization system protein ParE
MLQEKEYSVELAPEIYNQIESIQKYISDVLLAPQAAHQRVEEIFDGLDTLKKFPERGFDADERFGKQIYSVGQTKGLPIVNGKYIAFYVVEMDDVFVHRFVPSDSDYVKLFD